MGLSQGRGVVLVRRWRWWLAAAIVIVIAGVVGVMVSTSGDSTPPRDRAGAGEAPSASGSPAPRPSTPSASSRKQPSTRGATTGSPVSVKPVSPGVDPNAGRPHAKTASFGAKVPASGQVTVRVAKVEAIKSQAELPGETSRPALRITVAASDSGAKPVTIKNAVVNAYYGKDKTPAATVLKPGSKWFPEQIPAHGTVVGVFVFNVPVASRGQVTLEVDLDTNLKIVTFHGRPRA